jgi:hypothetical protein
MPRVAEPARFVAVTAAGVLAWITQAQRSPQRDLIEQLIERDADQDIDLRTLSQHMGLSVPELGRTLFALNRSRGLQVSLNAPAPAAPGARCLAGLQKDLEALVGSGQRALLVGRDGLCISAVGWSVSQASQLAARRQTAPEAPRVQATLCFVHETVTVLATADIAAGHPAWVALVRRLLPTCGAMTALNGVRT